MGAWALAARLLGATLNEAHYPWFLEAAFFWPDAESLHVRYRDCSSVVTPAPAPRLTERDVIDFARREIAATVGLESDARFFMAGGAFKSLLTGRPPRDIDLWTSSEQDRATLCEALEARGAERLPEREFASVYERYGRVVEVSRSLRTTTFEDRLGRFDIGLSAIGVEFAPNREPRAVIHPLAQESARRREVLLLRPLMNWKYALASLERLRRYAAELGFAVPSTEEAELRAVFEAQGDEMKRGMVERYHRCALGGYGVAQEFALPVDEAAVQDLGVHP